MSQVGLRSFTLIETLAALALLATLGVSILRIHSAAIRQTRQAEDAREIGQRVEALLWSWRSGNQPVTLPSAGEWSPTLRWERTTRPARIGATLSPTQVRLTVARWDGAAWDTCGTWSWLVPDPPAEDRQ